MRETVLSNLEGLRLASTSMERDKFVSVIMEQFDILYSELAALEVAILNLKAKNARLETELGGHDPRTEFPSEDEWVYLRDVDDEIYSVQYDPNIGWWCNYEVNAEGRAFSYWYPDNCDLVRWYRLPPLPEPPEVGE